MKRIGDFIRKVKDWYDCRFKIVGTLSFLSRSGRATQKKLDEYIAESERRMAMEEPPEELEGSIFKYLIYPSPDMVHEYADKYPGIYHDIRCWKEKQEPSYHGIEDCFGGLGSLPFVRTNDNRRDAGDEDD